jgi:hypothetical protein
LREFEGLQGKIYEDKWASPRKLGAGIQARVIWDRDLEGYNEFRRGLVADGTLPAPDDSALAWKLELVEKRINRKAKESHIPKVQQQLEKAQEEKEVLEEAKAKNQAKGEAETKGQKNHKGG